MFRKVSNGEGKVSNAEEKVSNGKGKVSNAEEKVSNTFLEYKVRMEEKGITERFIHNIEIVYKEYGVETVFGQSNIMELLDCSKSKATNIIKAMKQAGVIGKVAGLGVENTGL